MKVEQRCMPSLSGSLGAVPVPSPSVLRNDILKPVALGFMKEIPDKEVTKATDVSTVTEDNLKILETVRLPEHLEFKEVSKLLKKIIKKDMKKDPLHDAAVKLTNYAQKFYEKMELYFDEIFNFNEKVKEHILSNLFATSKEYVQSDLPPSYIRSLTLSFLTECREIDVFNSRIRRERLKLIGVRNNFKKFKRICDGHNRWVDFLQSSLDPMIDSRVRLIWYVDLNNSKSIKEAFKIKKLRRSNLDDEQFFGLLLGMQKKTEKIRTALVDMNRETFLVTLDRKDPTVDLLCNVMEIMS